MYFRPMPATWRYWVDQGELCLGPASMMPAGATSWDYVEATRNQAAVLAFLDAAEAAGVPAQAIADIKREQQL
jgi:hypothetical protein